MRSGKRGSRCPAGVSLEYCVLGTEYSAWHIELRILQSVLRISAMSLPSIARRVARLLADANCKVVFAESCTGGLVSATLTKIPGISEHHCGGMVIYRNETKRAYLGISPKTLKNPGPVSREVTRLLAERILAKTPESDVSLAVTGHLGPRAPAGMDGLVFVAVAIRRPTTCEVHELRCRRADSRSARQRWVVEQAFKLLAAALTALICNQSP